ncbi:hypothetical protein BD410DRAFT_808987 [Rickenella mellea]|uniref:Uncharacterized protein n=1 Tax=Rickenella mellea TaxID=50990 RepID=A0A4Y7PKK5_9AGAM|nr:hypothetical protein BD410DRAFT_808987 [Rickenella mellea]
MQCKNAKRHKVGYVIIADDDSRQNATLKFSICTVSARILDKQGETKTLGISRRSQRRSSPISGEACIQLGIRQSYRKYENPASRLQVASDSADTVSAPNATPGLLWIFCAAPVSLIHLLGQSDLIPFPRHSASRMILFHVLIMELEGQYLVDAAVFRDSVDDQHTPWIAIQIVDGNFPGKVAKSWEITKLMVLRIQIRSAGLVRHAQGRKRSTAVLGGD